MQANIKKENGTLFVAVSGRLDTVTSLELNEMLEKEGTSGFDIDFDFTDVEYISSAGLRLILALQRQVMETNNKMVIRNINKVVSEIFSVAGFNKTLKIV